MRLLNTYYNKTSYYFKYKNILKNYFQGFLRFFNNLYYYYLKIHVILINIIGNYNFVYNKY